MQHINIYTAEHFLMFIQDGDICLGSVYVYEVKVRKKKHLLKEKCLRREIYKFNSNMFNLFMFHHTSSKDHLMFCSPYKQHTLCVPLLLLHERQRY